MTLTTHQLAKILLSKEDTTFKFGHFVSNCGDTWWEEIEEFKYVFGEEGFLIEEKDNG